MSLQTLWPGQLQKQVGFSFSFDLAGAQQAGDLMQDLKTGHLVGGI
jgi:uncharacterized oligopeptide transporter (OPT) family protein